SAPSPPSPSLCTASPPASCVSPRPPTAPSPTCSMPSTPTSSPPPPPPPTSLAGSTPPPRVKASAAVCSPPCASLAPMKICTLSSASIPITNSPLDAPSTSCLIPLPSHSTNHQALPSALASPAVRAGCWVIFPWPLSHVANATSRLTSSSTSPPASAA